MADDIISRSKLMKVLKGWRRTIDPYDDWWDGFNTAFKKNIDAIEAAPTVDAVPVDFIKHQIEICEAVPAPFCAKVLRQLLENSTKMDGGKND